MQCPNCHFENMPGNAACMRCGTSLGLASATMAIHPPRASALSKRLRTFFPALRYQYWIRDCLAKFDLTFPAWLRDSLAIARLRAGTWPRMIIPGWAHRYEGRGERGRWFLLSWLAMAGLCVLTFGSAISAFLAGLMLAVHAGSMVDLAWQSRDLEDQRTVVASVAIWTAAACLVVVTLYLPLQRAAFAMVDTRQWMVDEPPLATGDVVLFRPRKTLRSLPQPGDVVVYARQGFSIQQDDHRILRRYAGEGMDRIIAGPESIVRWRNGELKINGTRSELRPLHPTRMPSDFEMQIPGGYVCIFPSTDSVISTSGSLELWTEQSLVHQEAILGRALVRHHPVWRFWWIR